MNNTIFRRKFVFGVLIALMFGFGVHGTVDALDTLTKPADSGDVELIGAYTSETHEFQFSTTGVTDSLRDDTGTTDTNERNIGDQLSVSASGGYITQVDVGGTTTTFPNNTTSIRLITMGELETDSNRSLGLTEAELTDGSPAVEVTVRPNRLGAVTLQVTHSQKPTGTTTQRSLSFVAYAVRPDSEVQGLTIDTSSSTQSPQLRFQESPSTVKVQLTGANRNYVRVQFVSDSGDLTDDWNGDGTADVSGTTITTFTNSSGVAEVSLAAATGTDSSNVTANILLTSAESHSVIYAYRSITLAATSPTDVPEGTVDQLAGIVGDTVTATAYTVTATDGGNTGIEGLEVTFEVLTPGGSLEEVAGFSGSYDDNFETNGKVITGTGGVATVNLQLGREPGIYMVRATTPRSNDVIELEAKAVAVVYTSVDIEKQAASIEVTSGNGQRGGLNRPLPNPLVVTVRNLAGLVLSGVQVTFSTDSGAISFDAANGDYDADGTANGVFSGPTANTSVGTERGLTINTDKAGNATVRYNVGEVPGAKKITAVITAYDSEIRQTEFNLNGSGTVTTPPPSGNNLSITPSSITATAGSRVSVTVNANQNGVPVSLFGLSGLSSVLENGRTGTAISFTIPSGTSAGRYTLRASASGYNAASITVTVQGAQTGVTPSLSRSSISGAPRAVIPVNVTLSGAGSGVAVNIGAPFNATESTNSSGVAQFSLRLPDTAGSGTANVTASSYTSRVVQLSYTVTGTAPTTGTQVRLVLPSGASNQLSGAAGSNVQLRARVTNTAGTGLAGVAVTFRSNNIDLATLTSGSNGDVIATYTVQTTAQTVTAVINDTTVNSTGASPVTFTVTPGAATTGPQSTRLNIFQPSTIAAVGASHPLTILMATTTGAAAVNQIITLTVRDSAQALISTTQLITGTNGRVTTPDTFRLPTTAGVYSITATSGTENRTITVTVVAVKLLKDSSDSVSGDDQEGDRGVVLEDPFVVKVVQDNTAETPMAGVPVTFTVTDGNGELSTSDSATSGDSSITVNSDANGDVEAYLVLGTDDEDNAVRASVGITGVADVTFSASGVLVPYELEIVSGDDQRIAVNRRSDPMIVRVTDEDGSDLQGVTVSFSSRGPSGATLSPRSAITDRLGEAEADLVSRAAGTYTITARVTGIPSVTFTITVGDLADSIRIVSGNNQRGDPGTQLSNPLVVEVLDDDGDTVSGVTVTFRVTGGGGSLSATSVSTNSSGRAQTTLTLGDSPGGNSVRASVSGVSTQVTFGATAVNPAPPEPVVHLGAGQRADSYWINTDSGTLHRLVGGSVENIASGVENVVSLVVTPDRLYWVEDTGNNTGRLRRSNLNGTNIQLIRDLTATPAGITVDTANNKIYMANAWGKVQAINADGSGYAPNLITGLSDPKDIAVGSGKVYWITGGGTVHSANVDGSGTTQIASGYDTLGSIAVGGGKVFWTETISESDGNIHSANLNGTGVTEVVSLLAAPYGISVDAGASKLYFTNSRGRIMQGNLDGSGIQIVASNLVALGDVSVPSGTAAPRPPGTFSQYDVNRDGTVDNTDAALVAAALGESPPSNPRLDVNGDGMVNFLDLLLVFDNRDNTNGAPVAVAKELPKVSREEIQNQIDLLLASDNQSATAQFTLAYLQNLLEVVTPEKTRLLANYPNPFNPETWIPYQLATSSNVQITIYNSAGREVRTLALGHQSKGYYTDRSSAAYWDGRNVIGEAVSSGVYFYTLTTDRMSATRKMLILK